MGNEHQSGWSSRGFTLVEISIASMIILVSLMALGFSMQLLNTARLKSNAVAESVALESSLVAKLSDPATFTDDFRNALSGGQIPNNFTFVIPNPRPLAGQRRQGDPPEFYNVTLNQPIAINDNMILKVDLKRKADAQGRFLGYAFAYSVSFSEELEKATKIKFATLGSNTSSNFAEEDYSLMVPGKPPPPSVAGSACDPNTTLGMRGVDGSGVIDCIYRSQNACPKGTLPIGTSFEYNAQTSHLELGMVCTAPLGRPACPSPYVLQSVSPENIVAQKSPGTCILPSVTSGSAGKTFRGRGGLEGIVCPRGYRLTTSCQIGSITATNGLCQNGTKPTARPGTLNESRYLADTGEYSISCQLQIPSQPCGATWIADVTLDVSCELMQKGQRDSAYDGHSDMILTETVSAQLSGAGQ